MRRNPIDPYYEIAIRDLLVQRHGFSWPDATDAIDKNRNRLDYWQNSERLRPDQAVDRILEPQLMYYALLIDETWVAKDQSDWFKNEFGVVPDKIEEVVVVSPEEKTYIASMQPSAYFVPVYYLIEGTMDEDVRDQIEQALIEAEEPGDYMDWYQAKKLADNPTTARRLGEFESMDDAVEAAHQTYPF